MPTILAIVAAGVLVVAHLEVLIAGFDYAGPLLILDHLFNLGLALLLLLLSLAAGHALLRRTGLMPEGSVEPALYSIAVGAGLWSLLFLALGAVGLLSPLWIGAAVVVGSVLIRTELGRIRGLAGGAVTEIRSAAAGGWLSALAVATTAGAAAFLLLHGSAPPGDWDSLMYHLEVPNRWLAEGRIFVPEGNLHVAYTGLVQILYLPFLAAGSPVAAALLNGAFALLLGLAVYVLGSRLLDPEVGTVSAILLWASTGLLMVAITPRVDTTLAFYLLLGHAAVVTAILDPSRARRSLLLGGVVLGLSVAVKYHAVAYGACLAPVGLWAVWKGGDRGLERARLLGLVAGVTVVAALPWILKNQILLGAPFYPFFTERMLPPWLADLYGSAVIPAAVDVRSFGLLGQARESLDLVALFVAPETLTVEPEAVHYRLNLLLLLLPLGLFYWRRRAVMALGVPALLFVAGIAIFRPLTNLRYLFPALAPLTLVASFVTVALLRNVSGRSGRRAVLALVALLALVPTALSTVRWTRRSPVLEHAVGQASRQDYLVASVTFYAAMAGSVNRSVPPDGKVLLLWEARGYYLAPHHIQDNVLRNWPLLVPYLDRAGSCLEETDITHVLVNEAAVGYYIERGANPGLFRQDRFRRFAERCMVVEEEGPSYVLYRLAT